MRHNQDPRLAELRRLLFALDAATQHLDEFDARVFENLNKIRNRAASIKSRMHPENGIAVKIAAGMAKASQGR